MAEPRSPALDPGSRAWALAVTAVCLAPLLLQMPGTTALAIGATGIAVGAISWRRTLPLVLRGLLAVAIIAAVVAQFGMQFGRDTGIALLGAMLALKPSETVTLRDARSLVGFALFAPFSTFLLDQGPATLVLGLAASLLAIAVLQRLTALEGGDAPVAPVRSLTSALRLVGYGLPLAMAVFWLFPRLATPLWGIPDRAVARVGLSDEMSPGDWTSLLTDPSIAARARFLGPVPPKAALYWRGPVLWDFDGRTWRRPAGLPSVAMPDPVPGTIRWAYTLEIEPTDRRQLIALDLPLAAPAGARLRSDHSLVAERPLASLTRWHLTSAPPASYRGSLPAEIRRRALALPGGFNPRTVALGRDLRARLRDDEAVIDRVLAWIRKDFAYSLAAPALGRDTVDEFLFGTRLGYCEHFAGAFTVLMRSAGIPTRVVTGYVGGERNRIGDYWMIRRMDAHAWTEVWLEGRGWARVDPTAAVAPQNIYDTLDEEFPLDGFMGAIQSGDGMIQVGDWLRQNWNDLVLGFDANRQSRMFRPLGLDRVSPEQLAMLFAVAALLSIGLMIAFSLRSPREQDPVLRAWHRLGERYARRGLPRAPHEPSTTWAERIRTSGAASALELVDLAARFTRWRYAGSIADGESARRLARDLRAHRPR